MNQHQDDTGARRGPIAWMVHNSIAANLLMVILLGGGIWSAIVIQKEVFPESQLDIVEVRVGYPGASPSEVEQGILASVWRNIVRFEIAAAIGLKYIQTTGHK